MSHPETTNWLEHMQEELEQANAEGNTKKAEAIQRVLTNSQFL